MNSVSVSGYLQKRAQYVKNELGENEFRFFLNVYSIMRKEVSMIPIKCLRELADECYAKVKVGYYLEIQGEIVRPSAQQIYILAHSLSYRAPSGVNTVHIRQTEFIETFSPMNALERIKPKEKKNEKSNKPSL